MQHTEDKYERLYSKLLRYAEQLHQANKRRIRRGLIWLFLLPMLLGLILLVTGADRIVFLIVWVWPPSCSVGKYDSGNRRNRDEDQRMELLEHHRFMRFLLATHDVTWSKRDQFCSDQYLEAAQPEEFPTAPVKTTAKMLEAPNPGLSFEKFNFDREVDWDE